MMIKRVYATFVFLLMFCGPVVANGDSPRDLSASFQMLDTPWEVPDLLFRDGNGREYTLHNMLNNELKGHYVLLAVWATWCTPCMMEMPSLDALQGMMGARNLTVLALSQEREGAVLVPAFYRRHGITNLKVFVDSDGRAIRRLRLRGIPTTILIAPDGNEIGRISRRIEWDRPDNVAALEAIMASR